MARKSKVRVDRIIILVLVAILVLGILGFGIYSLFGLLFKDNNSTNTNNNTNNIPVLQTTDGVNVSLVDYAVYTDDTSELGFNFIIAKLGFNANNPVSFEFKNLQTSEKIILNNISSYIKKMELAGYDVSKLEINTSGISSSENKAEAKLFIPFSTDASVLSVYNSVDATRIEFNIKENFKPSTSLKLADEQQIIEIQGAKVEVSDSYISSSMYHNDVEYILGSTQKVFTFRIYAHDIENGVKIVDAKFIRSGESDPIDCMSSGYSSEKDDNVLNQELIEGDNGALFFEIRTSEVKPNFSGVLLITFSNSDKVYEIPTTYE